ncbi:helix-turn-helix domain-containing protein [Kribbella sp. CA-245084]|uniref:helix-turn-helix domain-containing protein n=1 Tax=Kribbella sp. CA-245084 TaxID=3239940 RepID=UPI003D904011
MRYHSALGLGRDEITELVGRVFQVIEGEGRAFGRPLALGLFRQVVLVLMHFRQNVRQTMLADLYGISQSTVSRIYRSIMPLLGQVLCLHESEPSSVFANREVLVDGPWCQPETARTVNTTTPATTGVRSPNAAGNQCWTASRGTPTPPTSAPQPPSRTNAARTTSPPDDQPSNAPSATPRTGK